MIHNEEVSRYFAEPAISQSALKTLAHGPYAFLGEVDEEALYYSEKGHQIIGTGVDVLLTRDTLELGREEFNNYFYFRPFPKPEDSVKSVVHQLFNEHNFDDPTQRFHIRELGERIQTVITEQSYGADNWKMETKINRIVERGADYFISLQEAMGKQVLDPKEKDIIDDIVRSLTTNDRTKQYFTFVPSEGSGLEIKRQLAIFFKYRGHDCKALLDSVMFDHKLKLIYPIDLKTIGNYTSKFHRQYKDYRYDIQGAFYRLALQIAYPDYMVMPFEFVVESTTKPGQPLIYTMDSEAIHVAMDGVPAGNFGGMYVQEVLGITQLFEIYEYYLEHGFEEDKFSAERNGRIKINWSKIY